MPRKKTEPEVLQEEVLQSENPNPEMPIEELPAEQPVLAPQVEEAFAEEPATEAPVLPYGEEKEEAAEETPAEAAEPEKKSRMMSSVLDTWETNCLITSTGFGKSNKYLLNNPPISLVAVFV